MGNLIITKSFEGQDVKIIQDENGEPLFELYSTGVALGYVRTVKSKGKEYIQARKDRIDKVMKNGDITALYHDGQTFLNEKMLYDFMLEAKTDKCKTFRKWVTSEVLPEIRKTGGYIPSNNNDTDDDIMAKALLIANRKIKQKQAVIDGLQADSKYLNEILSSASLVTITQIAKDYGMSGKQLNDTLHQLKIQYKQNGQWLLYSSYQDKGYTHSKTIAFKHSDGRPDTKMITEWTQNGRKFLYEMLKSINVLPLIEKSGAQISIQNSANIQA